MKLQCWKLAIYPVNLCLVLYMVLNVSDSWDKKIALWIWIFKSIHAKKKKHYPSLVIKFYTRGGQEKCQLYMTSHLGGWALRIHKVVQTWMTCYRVSRGDSHNELSKYFVFTSNAVENNTEKYFNSSCLPKSRLNGRSAKDKRKHGE